jgi:hypothetical protein
VSLSLSLFVISLKALVVIKRCVEKCCCNYMFRVGADVNAFSSHVVLVTKMSMTT